MPVPPVVDSTQDGLARYSPCVISASSAFGESEFLTYVNSTYSISVARNLIKLISVKILSYDGNPVFRRNSLYDSSYDKQLTYFPEPEKPGVILTIPDGSTELQCPTFTTDSVSSLVLEFAIRIATP